MASVTYTWYDHAMAKREHVGKAFMQWDCALVISLKGVMAWLGTLAPNHMHGVLSHPRSLQKSGCSYMTISKWKTSYWHEMKSLSHELTRLHFWKPTEVC